MRGKLFALPRKWRRSHAVGLATVLSLCLRVTGDVTIGVNVQGVTESSPAQAEPDASGAAGIGSYAEFVNGAFGVFDKTSGVITAQTTDHAFWENAGISDTTIASGTSNPRLVYDSNSGRWFATEITNTSSANKILLAVSTGANPSPVKGNWLATSFSAAAAGSTYSYGAFPTLGIDANGVYIATDDQNSSSPLDVGQSASLFSIPKSDLLAATPSVSRMTTFYGSDDTYESLGFSFQPVIDFNPSKGNAVVVADNYDTLGVINRFNVTGTTTSIASLATMQTTTLAPYLFPPYARQPGSSKIATSPLDISDDRYASSVYQVGNLIYSVHTVGVTATPTGQLSAALQWSVLCMLKDNTTRLVQTGMISDPNGAYDYFNPSICANANGDVVIGYNRSGTSKSDGMILSLISVGSTSDGTIDFQNAIQVSSPTVTSFRNTGGNSPWGAYSSMTPDPTNSSIFWFTQEVPEASSGDPTIGSTWGTQIVQIAVPEPSPEMCIAFVGIGMIARTRRRLKRCPF